MSGLLVDTGGTDCCCDTPPPQIFCFDQCMTCSSVVMSLSGIVAGATDFTEGIVNNATVDMTIGLNCSWIKTFASGDCQLRDLPSGDVTSIDCNDLISTATAGGCSPAGSANGHPDVDSFHFTVKLGSGFPIGWCYRSLAGPCPDGPFVNFIQSFGCVGANSPNATPGTVSI